MVQQPYVMDADERDVVRDAIVNLAREKSWRLWALHVRSNHVHQVITADREPGRLMSDLKSRASRDLTRAGFGNATRRRWTRHGSTKHLFSWDSVQEKFHYTLYEQGNPMALYDGTRASEEKEPRTK